MEATQKITEQDLIALGFVFNTETQSYMISVDVADTSVVTIEVRFVPSSNYMFHGAKSYLKRGCHNETRSFFELNELKDYLIQNGLIK